MQQINILSKRVFETARKLPEIMPEPFVALEEYDRTGKLPVNFTIDQALFKPFKEYCEKHNRKMSPFLEKVINSHLRGRSLSLKPLYAVTFKPQRIFKYLR